MSIHDGILDPTYVAKANILNDAFREIGMGRYQVSLLISKCPTLITPLHSGISFSLPGLAGSRTFLPPLVSPSALQHRFDSDNLWPVITYRLTTLASSIHPPIPTAGRHRSYFHACRQRICFQGSISQTRAEHWLTRWCCFLGYWIRRLGTKVCFNFLSESPFHIS
jgi:hypothetical protein